MPPDAAPSQAVELRPGHTPRARPRIPRRLRRWTDGREVVITEDEVLRLDGPVVILGEPGMGKTTLMEHIASRAGSPLIRARSFVRRSRAGTGGPRPSGRLVIDALDEVPAAHDGEALDGVLGGLIVLGCPPCILSCRVADWRSATARSEIEDEYGQTPIELHLEPFDQEEAEAFLARRLGADEAHRVAEHFAALGPEELLGNPQNLVMIEVVGASGELPATRGELYDRAASELWREHRSDRLAGPLAALDEAAALDAAGAAFAALLLTGGEAISRGPGGSEAEGEIPVGSVQALPGARAADVVLGSRLFRAAGEDRFVPLHRTIAEHLGARWLAGVASTPRRRRRLLALIRSVGLVPASLRGLHAWLARSEPLARDIIAADPLGVVLHGDPDRLSEDQARALLAGLRSLDRLNRELYHWGPSPSIDGLFHPPLVPEVKKVICDRDEGIGLRCLLLGAISIGQVAEALRDDLLDVVLDPEEAFVVRDAAADALVRGKVEDVDWPDVAARLNALGGTDDLRLAIEVITAAGSSAFSDDEIVRHVIASAWDENEERGSTVLGALALSIPDERAAGILDHLSIEGLPENDRRRGSWDLHYMIERLLEVALLRGDVDPVPLWCWMRRIKDNASDLRHGRGAIANWLRANEPARRRIQRYVLLEVEDPKRDRFWRHHDLIRTCPALRPSEDDVIHLLRAAGPPPDDEDGMSDWLDLVRLADHTEGNGSRARATARELGAGHPAVEASLQALASPEIPEWQRAEQEREARKAAEEEERRVQRRATLAACIDDVRAGTDMGALVPLASAYLGRCPEVRSEAEPRQRLVEWVNSEVADAALKGFEALLVGPGCPSPSNIQEVRGRGKMLHSERVLAAALSARKMAGTPLADLDDDRVLAGAMVDRSSPMWVDGGQFDLRGFVEREIRRRPGLMERYLRITYELDLANKGSCSRDLHGFMHRREDAEVAVVLAEEWLERFDALEDEIEWYLVSRLARSGRIEPLLEAHVRRRTRGWHTDEERRRWTAVGAVFGDAQAPEAGCNAHDPDLIWSVRKLLRGEAFEKRPDTSLAPRTTAWVVRAFRELWPNISHPLGTMMGDANPWDASEYLRGMISRLANDTSDEAVAELDALRDAEPDSYTEFLRTVAREQAQKRAEECYEPPSLEALAAVLADAPPETTADLQAVMLEELDVVQRKLRAHPADWRRIFFHDAGRPRGEEACRDGVLMMLGDHPSGIDCAPEGHLAAGNRADIVCTAGALMLPIEVKGQWHPQVWFAAEDQLAPRYTTDWRAGGRGIYLVLWFGPGAADWRELTAPPSGTPMPTSASEFREALIGLMPPTLHERVSVVVLDLTLG